MFDKKNEKRFIIKEDQSLGLNSLQVLSDTHTGVHYLMASGPTGLSVTPLLNEKGQVVIEK